MSEPIAILLATYNGEPYLREQLDSLMAQSDQDFMILARDDGSTDSTLETLTQYARKNPRRLAIIPSQGRRLGPAGSFDELLAYAISDPLHFNLFMFCDQDDYWLPRKVEHMRELIGADAATGPLLGHCDMQVVDDDLNLIAPSFWRRYGVDPIGAATLDRILLKNQVTGHSCIFNRALAELTRPIPSEAAMHDWWLALTAAAFGRILTLDQPLSLYRQHLANTLGSQPRPLSRFLSIRHWREKVFNPGDYQTAFRQADAWLERYVHRLEPDQRRRFARLQGISKASYLNRRWKMLRSGVYPKNLVDFVDYLLKS